MVDVRSCRKVMSLVLEINQLHEFERGGSDCCVASGTEGVMSLVLGIKQLKEFESRGLDWRCLQALQ